MLDIGESELKNKIKSEKGLGLIGTVFLIILIGLFLFTAIKFVNVQSLNENLEDVKTDMLLLQGKVKVIAGEYTLNKKNEVLKGTAIKKMKEDEVIKNFLEKEIINIEEKNSKYYVINNQNLQDMELSQVTLQENADYIVNYTNYEVYLTNGYVHTDGNTYYSLSEINNLEKTEIIEKNEEKTEQNEKQEETNKEESKENKAEENKNEGNKSKE